MYTQDNKNIIYKSVRTTTVKTLRENGHKIKMKYLDDIARCYCTSHIDIGPGRTESWRRGDNLSLVSSAVPDSLPGYMVDLSSAIIRISLAEETNCN